MKLKLPSGTTGFWNDKNEWQCTGSQMGRRNELPEDRNISVRLRLTKLKWVDGDYDEGGAYWGSGRIAPQFDNHGNFIRPKPQDFIWCAWDTTGEVGNDECVYIFVRSSNRGDAKARVRELIPNARFYR